MISLKCPDCGFFFSIGFPDNITDEERREIFSCPCGATMEEVPFGMEYIPVFEAGEESR